MGIVQEMEAAVVNYPREEIKNFLQKASRLAKL